MIDLIAKPRDEDLKMGWRFSLSVFDLVKILDENK